jgi:hypothetical protein
MSKKLMTCLGSILILGTACNSSQTEKTETVVVTDTVVKTETVEVAAPIDSAAVTAFYEAAHVKAKGTHQVTHKTKSGKKVRVDSHLPIEHHDVMQVDATKATAADQPATGTKTEVIVLHDVETVYFRPDEPATFPGGEKAFDEYVHKNLEYPEEAVSKYVSGTIYAVMYLDEQGNVAKVEFKGKEIGYGLEAETSRLLLASPRWNPAKHAGVPVKSKFVLPVTFEIKN